MKDSTAKRIILWICIIVFGGGGTLAWWSGYMRPDDYCYSPPLPMMGQPSTNGGPMVNILVYPDGHVTYNGKSSWSPYPWK